MKKSKTGGKGRAATKRTRVFRAAVFASVLLGAGVVTAVARYGSRAGGPTRAEKSVVNAAAPAQSGDGFVTVEVGGKRLRVNAKTLQQGPLTQEQSRQIADALEGNKSTDGLVQVQHEDGAVSMDLQGRFRNVTVAKRNEDGSVSAACVDTPEAAKSFLQDEATTAAGPATPRTERGSVKE
jgi:hypothetical protein